MGFIGVICIAIGFLNLFFPQAMFKLNWHQNKMYQNSEPSAYGLALTRFGGIIAIIMGIIILFYV